MLIKAVLSFFFGFFLLYKGGDSFVDASVALARRWYVSEVLIGATIVSIGTTIPEITVSSLAAVAGEADIAYGNAIGSVICNTALIAGILLILSPSIMRRRDLFWGSVFFFGALFILLLFGFSFGVVNRGTGLLLLLVFVIYIAFNICSARAYGSAVPSPAGEAANVPVSRSVVKLFISAGVIFIGSNLLVNNGVILAKAMGVPETVVALTFIALGTSLPELVTAVMAILKGHSDVSLGNIVGANFINLTAVMGLSATIETVVIPKEQLMTDCLVAAAAMALLLIPTVLRRRTSRVQGVILICIYAAYLLFLFSGSLNTQYINTLAPYLIG